MSNSTFFIIFCQINIRSKTSDQNRPISDFQSQFSRSKIIQIFLYSFFIEEYQFRGMFFVFDIYRKLQFSKFTKLMLMFWLIDLERMLIWQKSIWKKVLFITQLSSHFNCWKILNVIYYLSFKLLIKPSSSSSSVSVLLLPTVNLTFFRLLATLRLASMMWFLSSSVVRSSAKMTSSTC